jgi:hypothetical protein
MDRRTFVAAAAATASTALIPSFAAGGKNERNRRPYRGIDWAKAKHVRTTTHGHCIDQAGLDVYLKRGFEFLTISNYYPSAPWWPASKMTENYWRLHHDHPVMVKGKRTDGPFDWNRIVDEWKDKLPEAQRKQFPFVEGGRLFRDLPEGIIEAPNAEHHSFSDSHAHLCAPGSAYASGTFDVRDRFQTRKNGYNFGCGEPWRKSVDRILDALIVPDGGGVTVNHPTWSRMKDDDLFAMLDYDPRVLGIEVYNFSGGDKKYYPWSDYWSENYWDRTLATGRQCFGFSVPDWSPTRGVNILVVPEKTMEACLRAYRRGDFYFGIFGGIVSFTHVSFDGRNFKAGTDKPVRFELISRRGKVAESTGTSFKYRHDKSKNIDDVYLRLKAYATDDSGEIIFSQPMMLS